MSKLGKRKSLRTKMMEINIGITLSSFVLCGFLFVMAVYLLVGKYVNHDFDFFLTQVSDNLNSRLEYMESVIYNVRDSKELMSYLQEARKVSNIDAVWEEFKKTVDINYTKNQGEGGNPVVEKIYLFRKDGTFLSDFYYAMIYSEIQQSDIVFANIFESYKAVKGAQEGFVEYCQLDDDKAYMAYSVLDDMMQEQGILIFEVNLQTIRNIMDEMKSYDKSFWLLYHEEQLLDSFQENLAGKKLKEFQSTRDYAPHIVDLGNGDYRVYSRRLCLNLWVTVGIPEYQAMVVLYNSSYIYVIGIIIILCVGVLSFGMFTYKVTKPVEEVTERLKQVQEGNFETKLPDYDTMEFHEISQVFNQMTDYIHHLVNQVYEKQISVKELELKFLQTQMNPHFMFNVLNALALQAKIDGNEEICKLISTFSQLIQARVYRSETEKVQVKQELTYVNYYLEIQKFRFGERLAYSVTVKNEAAMEYYIPKLCIQMIVENAVVHGLEPKMTGGNVEIVIEQCNDELRIEITDDGVGFEQSGFIQLPIQTREADSHHNHIGLNNVHHIIQLMYGKEFGITVFSESGKGTKAGIRMPVDRGK